MSARHLDCMDVYNAADIWVDRALRRDDSLFTPGTPIWSREPLREARAVFLNNKDDLKGSNFFGRLERSMAGSPPEVYQLMGEAAYVAYLILYKGAVSQAMKVKNVNLILGWSSKPVEIPDCLLDGLRNGIMAPGPSVNFKDRLKSVIKFAERWKTSNADVTMLDRDKPEAPWRFQEFVMELNLSGARRVPLLHLVHPDTFEAVVWTNKVKVARAPEFRHFVTEPTSDVERRIHQIRAGLEREFPKNFDFFHHPICPMWNDNCKH